MRFTQTPATAPVHDDEANSKGSSSASSLQASSCCRLVFYRFKMVFIGNID
jgi:hypothetical protein